jgi:WD40 repeat protein
VLCGAGQAQTIAAAVGQGIRDDNDHRYNLKPGQVGTIVADDSDHQAYNVRAPSGETDWYKASDVVATDADSDGWGVGVSWPSTMAVAEFCGVLAGHTQHVTSAAFSPEGQKIVSASWDKTIRIWDAATGDCQLTMEGHTDYVNSAAFSPDGLKIVSASEDMTMRVWDVASGNCEHTMTGYTHYVTSATFSPEGRQIVSGSGDTTVRVWDAATGESRQALAGHAAPVTSAQFGPEPSPED